MDLVTNFRSWPDMVERGWGTMRKTGTRWEFVPRLDEMVTVPGITGKVNRHVAPLVVHLKGWLEVHRGRTLDAAGNWALSVRPIRGREAEAYAGVIDAWSIHSCGGAVDFEAPRNPLGELGRGDFPDGWLQECHRWGFAWGAGTPHGDYVGRADRMHVEFVGDVDQADAYCALLEAELAGTPAAAAAPADREDDPVSRIPLAVGPDGTFAETVMVEVGSSSAVVAAAWLTFGTGWAGAHFDVYAIGADGKVMGPAAEKHRDLGVNGRDFLAIPDGAVMATISGKITAGAKVGAALVVKAK